MGPPDNLRTATDLDAADLDAVIASWTERRREAEPSDTVRPQARTTRLDHVRPQRVRWLWPGRIPLAKLTVFDGDPGLGKSTVMLDVGARVTCGASMPDGSVGEAGAVGVVILTAEDGLADTIRPRLDAAGAICARVVALEAVRDTDGRKRLPTVGDVGAIYSAIAEVDAALVIIDPLMAYLGADTNAHRDQDVRSALALLAELAEQTDVAIVAIRHLNKTAGRNPIYRGGGSIGIIGGARSGLLVARDPDDPEGPRRILAPTKTNLAAPPPSLAYTLAADDEGRLRVSWVGESRHSARALLAEPEDDGERSALDQAREVLREELADGPRPAKQTMRVVREAAGVSERTVRRARELESVVCEREGYGRDGRWMWRLPIGGQPVGPPMEGGHLATYGENQSGCGVSGDGRPIGGQTGMIDIYGADGPPDNHDGASGRARYNDREERLRALGFDGNGPSFEAGVPLSAEEEAT